jgi:tryptophanyl-tRNA synthetase
VCNLFPFHELDSPKDEVVVVDVECRTAARGCVDCKKHLIRNMNAALEPIRQKRAEIVAKKDFVKDVLEDGNTRARAIASETMEKVSNAMSLL